VLSFVLGQLALAERGRGGPEACQQHEPASAPPPAGDAPSKR
jgi:hypothetical protein